MDLTLLGAPEETDRLVEGVEDEEEAESAPEDELLLASAAACWSTEEGEGPVTV